MTMKLTKKTIDGEDVYFENGVKKYTHFKNNDGDETWSEYDSNNNEIHFKTIVGFEWWKEYDSNGNEIYYKNSDGYEWWSDTHPNNPKNKVEVVVEVDIEPFTFNKLV